MAKPYANIKLTEEEKEPITKYKKALGDKWVEEGLQSLKVKKYIQENLELISDRSRPVYSGNCYIEQKDIYKRRDGNPISQDDIITLNDYIRGQKNIVKLLDNGMEVEHHWACDSSG